MAKKLYIGNLDYTVTEEDLEPLFSEHGEIVSLVVIKDRYSGRSKGFAFVEYATSEEADRAKHALGGHEVKGRAIRVDDARERRSDRGGDRGGGFSGRSRY